MILCRQSLRIIALFEKIYEEEPSSQISGMMYTLYNTVVSIEVHDVRSVSKSGTLPLWETIIYFK